MRSRGTWAGDVGRTVDLETSIWSQISPIPSAPKLPAQSQINLKLEEKVESTCNGHAERSKRISCKICYEMLQKLVDLVSKMHLEIVEIKVLEEIPWKSGNLTAP